MVEERTDSIRSAFQTTLNSHGYSFQAAVVGQVLDLAKGYPTNILWELEATEFPVLVQNSATKIDFILRHKRGQPFWIIAECKRANPAYSDWCFVAEPEWDRSPRHSRLIVENFDFATKSTTSQRMQFNGLHEKVYHVAVEVKTDKKGEKNGDSQGAIEKAASQVFRGIGGIVHLLKQHPILLDGYEFAQLLPVIFTTANLWTSEIDLRLTDLPSGNIDLNEAEFCKRDFLFYQYHVGPQMKTTNEIMRLSKLSWILDTEYSRTIAIVNPAGIQSFLKWASDSRTVPASPKLKLDSALLTKPNI